MTSALNPSSELLASVDRVRQDTARSLDPDTRAELGQYFTPATIARLMAQMPEQKRDVVRVLDPGAGVGILTAAWVEELCGSSNRPREVHLTAFELDRALIAPLTETLE